MVHENIPALNDCHGRTATGRQNQTQQGRFLIADLTRRLEVRATNFSPSDQSSFTADRQGKLLILADGVGSDIGGGADSTLAVQTVCDYVLNSMHRFVRLADERDEDFRDELAVGFERCHRRLQRERLNRSDRSRTGTVLTMAYIVWPIMYVVHAGNCRCYLQRNDNLRQLTTDHTVAQQFVNGGAMQTDKLADSPWRHVIWNCLAGEAQSVAPEVTRVALQQGDVVLLCSHGLTNRLRDGELTAILGDSAPAEMLTQRLIDAAGDMGSHDNATAIVARFVSRSPTVRTRREHWNEASLFSTSRIASEPASDGPPRTQQSSETKNRCRS